MKKLFIILCGLIFALSTTGLPLAQEKTKPEKAPEAIKSETAKKEASAEPMEYRVGGVITNISTPAKQITIKQHQVKRERVVTLTLSGKIANSLPDLKVGDSVNVWVKGKRITALQKVS